MVSKTFKKRDGQEFTIFVDNKDSYLLEEYSWFLRNGCAATTMRRDGKEEAVYLHRLVLKNSIKRHEKKTKKRARIVFVDGNKLNCQSGNVKIQRDNKKSKKKGTSKYRGISFDTRNKKWRGKITVSKEVIIDQLFDTEYDAWKAVDDKRQEHNQKNPNKPLKREEWNSSSASKKKPSKEIYDNFKEKIDDKFNRYFRTSTDVDQERDVQAANISQGF